MDTLSMTKTPRWGSWTPRRDRHGWYVSPDGGDRAWISSEGFLRAQSHWGCVWPAPEVPPPAETWLRLKRLAAGWTVTQGGRNARGP